MKKNDIIQELNKLNIKKNEFWVIGSSSLVLRNIMKEANDIDLAITKEAFEKINKNEIIYLGENNNKKWYKLNNNVEFCIDKIEENKVDIQKPYNLLNLEYYYNNIIKNSTREKDKEKKELLSKILSTYN